MELTRAEFYAKYGEVEVTFSSYYKYTFTFSALLPDGKLLSVDYGGSSDGIYRYEVTPGHKTTVTSLYPYAGRVYENGKEVESFYDF